MTVVITLARIFCNCILIDRRSNHRRGKIFSTRIMPKCRISRVSRVPEYVSQVFVTHCLRDLEKNSFKYDVYVRKIHDVLVIYFIHADYLDFYVFQKVIV